MSNFEKKVVPYLTYLGTRPPTVDEWEKYELHHRSRMSIKPGITGMWQASGRSDITDFEEVVKLDTAKAPYKGLAVCAALPSMLVYHIWSKSI